MFFNDQNYWYEIQTESEEQVFKTTETYSPILLLENITSDHPVTSEPAGEKGRARVGWGWEKEERGQ